VKKNTAIAAVTVYALADAEQRIGPRQSRAEIEQLLQKSGLEDSMKEGPLWDLWLKSDRGREP
jgi:hypothetical protein